MSHTAKSNFGGSDPWLICYARRHSSIGGNGHGQKRRQRARAEKCHSYCLDSRHRRKGKEILFAPRSSMWCYPQLGYHPPRSDFVMPPSPPRLCDTTLPTGPPPTRRCHPLHPRLCDATLPTPDYLMPTFPLKTSLSIFIQSFCLFSFQFPLLQIALQMSRKKHPAFSPFVFFSLLFF